MNGGRHRSSWTEYALQIAEVAAGRSEDPYKQVGACALRENHTIAGVGYNGAPSGVVIDWTNRDARRKRVVHAEVNALRDTKPGEVYLLACTMLPCLSCLSQIASYGVKQVVYREGYSSDAYGTEEEVLTIFKEFGISVQKIP